MSINQAKDLFQLQTELVETKVDMAVSRTIDRVVEQINSLKGEMHAEIRGLRDEMHTEIRGLRSEMHGLRNEMHNGFSSLDKRVVAIETKLGMVNETQKEIRTKFIDYSFKAGWLILGIIISYALIQLHVFIK